MADAVIAELERIARKAKVFVSMPWVPGLSPRIMGDLERVQVAATAEAVERRHAILDMDEAALSPLDHGGLYGDAVFEGILVNHGQVFVFKEHLVRWYESARKTSIAMPYPIEELAALLLEAVKAVGFRDDERGYLRPVLTRGCGNLGIHPKKCVAPTVYCIVSTIQLYPPEAYEIGIELAIARAARRATRDFIDPNIKSNNYLNNIFALLETMGQGRLETLMLTPSGAIAEASADNVFAIERPEGWQSDPSKVVIRTPSPELCLIGITRNLIMREARALGYTVLEVADLMPIDLVGEGRECFLTGTGAGVMPVVGVAHVPVGDGQVGPVTRSLLDAIRRDMQDPAFGLSIHADASELAAYLARAPVI